LGRRHAHAGAGTGEALHLVELSLAGLAGRRQGPPPRPHLGRARVGRPPRRPHGVEEFARLDSAFRPRAGDGDSRRVGWAKARRAQAPSFGRARARAPCPRVTLAIRTTLDAWARRCDFRLESGCPLTAPLPTLLITAIVRVEHRAHIGDLARRLLES